MTTVATDSIFLTGVIDAKEQQAIAILDIANVFQHAENDEKIIILLRGRLTEMMIQVDPSMYRKYVTYSPNGQALLYFRLNKALYGILIEDLMFYKRLRTENPKKVGLKGVAKKSISPRAKQTAKRRSVLEVDKYAPDESPKWKLVNARFPALYKAILADPDAATHGDMMRQAVIAAG